MSERRRISANTSFESVVGYSRAVRVGDRIFVSGTAPIMADGGPPPPDAYAQARRCLEIITGALAELGAGPEHVVRSRVYLVRAEDWEGVARAHGETFGQARPANTFLVVAALLDPRWRVEIEVDAVVGEPG